MLKVNKCFYTQNIGFITPVFQMRSVLQAYLEHMRTHCYVL